MAFILDEVLVRQYDVSSESPNLSRGSFQWYDKADIAWMMICSALVGLMVCGQALVYSGATNRKHDIQALWLPVASAAVALCQWYVWGYSFTFTESSSFFFGGDRGMTLNAVLDSPTGSGRGPKIPEMVYQLYQGMFASFAAAIVGGAAAGKGRTLPFLVYIFLWSTFGYNIIARWSWSSQGWANSHGSLDSAGGTAVHISSAAAAGVYTYYWKKMHRGPRKPEADNILGQTSRITRIAIGTALLAFGWIGFNGGATCAVNLRVVAVSSTVIAGAFGGLTWCLLAYIFNPAFPTNSIISFSNGTIAGLVAITPGSTYVPTRAAPVFGIGAAIVVAFLQVITGKWLGDDLDIVAIHGIAGMVGMGLTGVFARRSIVELDGWNTIKGGWWPDRNGVQMGWQIADALAGLGWSAFVAAAVLGIMHWIVKVEIRWVKLVFEHKVLEDNGERKGQEIAEEDGSDRIPGNDVPLMDLRRDGGSREGDRVGVRGYGGRPGGVVV